MATTYTDTVARVRDWANRIGSNRALDDSVIEDALTFAADEAYRLLEVASLEYTGTYPALVSSDITQINGEGIGTLRVPRDSTGRFIQIRRTGRVGNTTQSVVYNTRQDLRGFEDQYHRSPDYENWTRKGNNILVQPAVVGDVFEIHYYRRLPALDARYTVNAANANTGGLLTESSTATPPVTAPTGATEGTLFLLTVSGTPTDTTATAATTTYYDTMALATTAMAALPAGQTGVISSHTFFGNESFNWLRDEQNKILLFGALWHVADYLEEDQQSERYSNKFGNEIQSLNTEERQRRASGGNTTMTFRSNGLI